MTWANIYLARSFGRYFSFEEIRPLYILFAGISVLMIFGLFGFSNSVSQAGSVVYKFSAILMGLVLYLFITVIIVNLLSLLVPVWPINKGIIVVVSTLIISILGIVNSYNIKVRKLEIPMPGLERSLSLIHLSDIHIGHFRGEKFIRRIVKISGSQNPDMVLITGDLFDGRIRLKEEVIDPFTEIKVPVYFVEGNHDGYTGVAEIKTLLRKKGIRVLENEVINEGELQIVGLNHLLPDKTTVGMHATLGKETIKDVLPALDIDPNRPSILMHHSPDGIQYASKESIDLYLSGHTHAGQLFPITLINDLVFKYNRGLDSYKDTRIFVSQGVGTFGPPIRIGTRSEIVLIKLVPEKK
jgi:predicted MPP superfamily phosphohydrolase